MGTNLVVAIITVGGMLASALLSEIFRYITRKKEHEQKIIELSFIKKIDDYKTALSELGDLIDSQWIIGRKECEQIYNYVIKKNVDLGAFDEANKFLKSDPIHLQQLYKFGYLLKKEEKNELNIKWHNKIDIFNKKIEELLLKSRAGQLEYRTSLKMMYDLKSKMVETNLGILADFHEKLEKGLKKMLKMTKDK